ncbi:hypothetical protein MYMAC_002219 [Corallococcus macrosporus DSM 14697]|uniref:Uncharacterized protein n=2 Tax=Corallococcus macrosporus TaxID=35 RepID=A0A250JRV9_9BACT|nr:hypothetical protein MYMAC_002219 [Corallococcus macrosporus DSM 14697]
MPLFSRKVLALLAFFMSSTALAGETWVQGRATLHACVYAHTYEAQVELNYRNYDLPWGTSVYLIYGWGGLNNFVPYDWEDTQTIEVFASAPWTWSTTVTSIISTRTTPKWAEHIDFVWKVVLPNGHEFYEKGNNSTWGYYAASLLDIADRPCTSDGNFVGPMYPLSVTSIEKW